MEVVVFGAGSLGSLVGGLLARAHEVTLVGRAPHVERIRSDGLEIAGEIEATIRPDAATDPPSSADLAVVTVKAYDTETAANALADGDFAAALSLQNGLGNEAVLADHLDCPVLAGTCTYGARLDGPGRVECTGVGEVVLGPRDGGHSEVADAVGDAFSDARLDATVAANMPLRLWEKLAVNAAINATTALARVPNGTLAEGAGERGGENPVAGVARAAAVETAAVARANGVDLADEQAVAATERVVDATAANRSSMLQDVERGRRTEVDAINGAVVERATAGRSTAGAPATVNTPIDPPSVETPINETLAALVRAWEAQRDLR